jgi:hypothetical protein
MGKVVNILVFTLLTTILWAQSPEKISYQAVVRSSNNALLTNAPVGMQISFLKDSTSGNAVYVETQTPTTNANGLISVEIGGGQLVSGHFSTIDWSKGPYFLKTEIDPTGGINYTVMGISQLLSVPFALHAKTAESINNDSMHYVGEMYGGGVVGWVDHTGKHGLILSAIDLNEAQIWSNITNVVCPQAESDWDGLSNSEGIVAQEGHTTSAAKLCLDYTNADYGTGIYWDWYLPSIRELSHIWDNLYEVQIALDRDSNPNTLSLTTQGYSMVNYTFYCSSTEFVNYKDNLGATLVYYCGFRDKDAWQKSNLYHVRAVRAF